MTARPGAGPLDGDIPLPVGPYQASRGRALAENARPSRSRAGRARRTLDTAELGESGSTGCPSQTGRSASPGTGRRPSRASCRRPQGRGEGAVPDDRGSTCTQAILRRHPARLRHAERRCHTHQDRNCSVQATGSGLRLSAPQNRPVADPRDLRYEHLLVFEGELLQQLHRGNRVRTGRGGRCRLRRGTRTRPRGRYR